MTRIMVGFRWPDGEAFSVQLEDERGGPDVLDDLTNRARNLYRDALIDTCVITNGDDTIEAALEPIDTATLDPDN